MFRYLVYNKAPKKQSPVLENGGLQSFIQDPQSYLTNLFKDLPAVNPGVLVAGI